MTAKKLVKDPMNTVVAGVGGQGNLAISSMVGDALIDKGYFVAIGETYGASQRGGAVMSHVRVSSEIQYGPLIPDGGADIVIGMEPLETLRILGMYGNPEVITVVNPRPTFPLTVTSGEISYPDLDMIINNIKALSKKTYIVKATEEAQKMGNPMLANVILVGSLVALDMLPLDFETLEPIIKDRFPKAIDVNLKAFAKGRDLIKEAA